MNTTPRQNLSLLSTSLLTVLAYFALTITPGLAGTLDPTFDTDGRANTHIGQYNFPLRVFVLPDGKILVVGETAQVGFHFYAPSPVLARYNSDGTLDNTFGTNGTVPGQFGNIQVNDVLLQPDGKIVFIGGIFPSYNMPPLDFAIVRYNSNGTLDTSFGFNGYNTTSIGGSRDSGYAGVLQPDGKILVFGGTNGTQGSGGALDIVRYNSNGSLDATFGDQGIVYYIIGMPFTNSRFTDAVLLADGKFLVNGEANGDFTARINADGTFDNTYGTNGYVYNTRAKGKITLQPDGKFLIANSFLNSTETYEVTRFNSDGSVDTGFATNGIMKVQFRRIITGVGFMQADVSQVALKSNGDIISIGYAKEAGVGTNPDPYYFATALSDSNGTLISKTTIQFPVSTISRGMTAAIQPNGRIVLAGTTFDGADFAVARLMNITNDFRPFERRYNFSGGPSDIFMVYRPGTGGNGSTWFNYYDQGLSPQFGIGEDIITPADYDDDGIADLAVFRPSNGTWYIANRYATAASDFRAIQWGTAGDIPAAADYDGDSRADVAVFRPSTGIWYILNSQSNSMTSFQWGISGDKPVVGDYDGDGKADVAVFRPSNGYWYILRSSDSQFSAIQFGVSSDILVQADYNGDNITDIAVFRPSTGTWYTSTNPAINYGAFQFGLSSDIPVPGDYDGDGKSDIAVWRPANRTWYVINSSNGSFFGTQWGASTDIPVPGH